MDDIDRSAERILERARARQRQLDEVANVSLDLPNNENVSPKKHAAPPPPLETKEPLNPQKAPAPAPPVVLRSAENKVEVVDEDDSKKRRRSRFSELAESVDNFEYKPRGAMSKECFMNSFERHQMSLTERVSPKRTEAPKKPDASPQRVVATSPSKKVVPAPALPRVVEEPRQIVGSVTYESRMSFNTSKIDTFADETIEAQHGGMRHPETIPEINESEMYGIQNFFQKNPQAASSPLNATALAEKHAAVPTSPQKLAPVHLRDDFVNDLERVAGVALASAESPVTKTSSGVEMKEFDFEERRQATPEKKHTPLKHFEQAELEEDKNKEMTPTKKAALEAAKAKTIASQFEERFKTTGYKVPTPRVVGGPASTTVMNSPKPPPPPGLATPGRLVPVTLSQGVKWEPTHTTAPETKENSRASPFKEASPPKTTPKSKVQSLKERWEVSSVTGTPLNPEQSQNELIEAAVKMSASVNAQKRVGRLAHLQQKTLSVKTESVKSPVKDAATETSTPTMSPREKSARIEELDSAAEGEVIDDAESDEEMNAGETFHAASEIDRMFEFMKSPKAAPLASDEKLSPQKPVQQRHVVESEDSGDDQEQDGEILEEPTTPGRLVHSISMYRKRKHVPKPNLVFTPSSSNNDERLTFGVVEEDVAAEELEAEKARLDRAILVEQERIAQASRALMYCKGQEEFRGSREEVDAQRALLLANETRKLLCQEQDRLLRSRSSKPSSPLGGLTFSNITMSLNRDFVNGQINIRDILYYFIVLIKSGSQVFHTNMVSSDDALKRQGLLEFNHYLAVQNLSPNFQALMEVYCLRSRREVIPHEAKYKLKGGTLKHGKKDGTLAAIANFALGSSTPSAASTSFTYLNHQQVDTSFQLVGRLNLDIHSAEKKKFQLIDPRLPLDVTVSMKIKKFAMEKGQVTHRNFISLYQRAADGLGSWTRYWCLLNDGELKFWRCPEDEEMGKKWAVYIDLQTCASSGVQAIPKESCPFPFSFKMDVWTPSSIEVDANGRPKLEKLSLMFAADKKDDMQSWLEVLNKTVNDLLTWNSHST